MCAVHVQTKLMIRLYIGYIILGYELFNLLDDLILKFQDLRFQFFELSKLYYLVEMLELGCNLGYLPRHDIRQHRGEGLNKYLELKSLSFKK